MTARRSLTRYQALLGIAVALSPILLGGCRHPAPVRGDPPRQSRMQFREVAGPAGLDFRWGHGGRSPLTILETLGHGCAFLDYDGDGYLDVWLLSDHGCALYRNRRNGTFENVTVASGADVPGYWHGIATGDFDNDGDVDVCLAGYRCRALLRNDGGRFTDVGASSGLGVPGWGSSCGAADLDADGRLDLVVGDYLEFGPRSVQFCTSGNIKSACGPKIYPARFARVYRNVSTPGRLRFEDVTERWGFRQSSGKTLGIAFGDFDGDGRLDAALANDEMPQDLFLRVGDGQVRFRNEAADRGFAFLASGSVQSGMGIDVADYDGDGREDLVITNFQNEPAGLYHSQGQFFADVSVPAGLSEPTYPLVGWGVRFLDADNDGNLDLIMANGHIQDNIHLIGAESSYAQPLLLFAGDGRGSFLNVGPTAGPVFSGTFVGRGLATGDYDNDGRMDALVVDIEGHPLLLHNQSATGNHWLGFEALEGSPPRPALGALVTVGAANWQKKRRVATSGSIFSAHDPRVHFGLGAATQVERVLVEWPDGGREEFPPPPVEGYHRLVRGIGRAVPRGPTSSGGG